MLLHLTCIFTYIFTYLFAPKTCVYLGSVVVTARQSDSQQGMDLHQFFLKRVLRKKSDKEIVQKGATITEKLVQIEKLFLAGSVPQNNS